MQSYLDVSMLIVIGTAVVLLLFILISFILLSRRNSYLENLLVSLRTDYDKKVALLDETKKQLDTLNDSYERRMKASERSLHYVSDTLQDLIDKQRRMDTSFDDLTSKIERQKKEFENNSVENQPIILAKRLLSEGYSVAEVVDKTSLPSYEVEMLSKVHKLSSAIRTPSEPARSVEEEARLKTEEFTSSKSADNSMTVASGAARSVHHVASQKAREAYGISKPLRRPR
ncbi:MAG: hypothetical protein ACI4NE_06570 [Succinivibrio sp.]